MAEYCLPEFDNLISRVSERINECASDLRDFRQALRSSDSPEIIIDEYESRKLLRQVTDESVVN